MQTVEITAKTLDEAKKQAGDRLGVASSDLSVTVLEETKGLFGKSSVRIRADVVSAPVAAPVKAPTPSKTITTKRAPEATESVETKPERGRKAGPKKAGKEDQPEPQVSPSAVVAAVADERTEGGAEATQEDATNLTELVKSLLSSADMEITAKMRDYSGRYVNVQLDGRDAAFLVGKNGEVLNAMQYLVNIIAGRRYNNGVRVTLDANDYRRRREDALTKLANKIADQVEERGEEAVLDALPAFERRIVHKALSVRSGISTYSEGEEPNRRVVIAPAD